MRRTIRFLAASITTIAVFDGSARAGVSDDLVFCSKLASPRERIACYDAAARIAANAGPSRVSRTAAPVLVTAPAADTPTAPTYAPTVERSRFQGLYAAIGGGYGLSSPRSVNLGASIIGGLSDTLSAEGFSGRAALGYNATLSNFLFGAEVAGRFGRESISIHNVQPASAFTGLAGSTIFDYRLQNDASIHIAARAGLLFDNTLVFGRAGVGASHIQESASVDTRGVTCPAIPGPLNCLFAVVPGLAGAGKSRWVPSAVFGAGAEHNFGPLFARLEGEIEVLALQSTNLTGIGASGATSEPFWFARIMASIGVRF